MTVSTTLGVTGASTIAALSATSGTFSTTLGVTGTSTLAAVNASALTLSSKEIINYNGASSALDVYNLSATGYGMYTQGGSGATYALSVNDYTGANRLTVTGAGAVTIPGTLGVGTSSAKATLQVGTRVGVFQPTTDAAFGENLYYSSGWKYIETAAASVVYLDNGSISFLTAPSGSADAAATVTSRMSISNAGAVTIPGTLGVTGTFTPGQTTGIVGTTTNNNAQAGSVGEYVSSTVSSGSPVSMVNSTTVNVTSISLTAGDWDVSGSVAFSQPGATNVTNLVAAVNSSSATLPNADERSVAYIAAAGIVVQQEPSLKIISTRYSLSGTTTIYLVAYTNFSISTLSAYGRISARRVR